jgi:hypothetical protein
LDFLFFNCPKLKDYSILLNGTVFVINKRTPVPMKKTTSLLLLLFCFCMSSHSQVGIDTIPYEIEFRDDPVHLPVVESRALIEKLYLHTDRTYYYPGDDIWFKAYLIDAESRLLTDQSNNLHVDLIAPSSKIISSRVIRLDSGLGNGDFRLPEEIRSGRYKIRAYTNYMRNFSEQLFFNKEIFVVNSSDEKDGNPEQTNYVENKIQLSFFPEGGSLINNVSSIVALKAVNSLGKGCDVSGKIFSSEGDLITSFRSTHLGMGSFFLRPSPGLSYYSVCRWADSLDIRTELPRSISAGVTLGVLVNPDNELLITAKTNAQTLQLIKDDELILTFSTSKDVIRTMRFKISSPVTNFAVPADDLPNGILMLSLFTSEDLPLSERLVFIQKEATVSVKIVTDKPLYSKREPVSLRLSMSGESAIERNGNVSLAAVDGKLIENSLDYPRSISSWFLLESDVRGNIEDPSYYFDPSNPARLKDLDLLLRTQGWRDFAWKYDTIYFPPENGFTVSGRLGRFYSKKSIDSSRVSIGVFESNNTYFTSVQVDSSGRFRLSGLNIKGEAKLIVSGIDKKDRMKGLLTLDSIKYNPPNVSDSLAPGLIMTESTRSGLKTFYQISEAIRKKYKLSDTIGLGGVNIISERRKDPQTIKIETSRIKYGIPDAQLIVTEQMVSYPDLVAVLKGKIPGVEVVGYGGNYKIIMRGGSRTFMGQTAPLILIDGNPSTLDDMISMPIFIIDRIDVLKSYASTNIFGYEGNSGVLNIITKAGGSTYAGVSHSANLKIKGYNVSRIFYSPEHLSDSGSEYNPDLRSTLLWKPDINLVGDKELTVKFYNGDNTSMVRIIAEGITSTGIPITGKAEYEIK